jgi:putative YhgA-like transposase
VADQDHSYKLLFGHPQMVRHLLEGFVGGEWLDDVDFDTLERVSDAHVSDDLRARANDMIWRVRRGEHSVYFLFEFQAEVERFMAVRVLTYVGLLYQDLIRAHGARELDRLPAILPIVLHSGSRQWRAPTELHTFFSNVPSELQRYAPRQQFLLIDEGRFADAELARHRNFAAMLFRLENCRDLDRLTELVGTLGNWLREAGDPSLGRAFSIWLRKVVLRRLADEPPGDLTHSLEGSNMLSENVERWERELEERGLVKGLEQGREQGLEQGRHQGAAALLASLLEARFHDSSAWIEARLKAASTEQLVFWGQRVLTAATLQEVFEEH